MIEEVIKYINALILQELTYYKSTNGLCELIQKDGKTFPAKYCNNQYDSVYNVDRHQNSIYHRLNGNVSIVQVEESETTGCWLYLRKTYPIKAVTIVNKNVLTLKLNDNYIDLKVAENLVYLLSAKTISQLAKQLKLQNIAIDVKSISVNRDTIWSTEFKGNPMKLDYSYAICSIDYDLILEGSKSCFEGYGC